MNRKEYNDRWSSPLVNPAITLGDYEKAHNQEVMNNDGNDGKCHCEFPTWSMYGRPYCKNCLGDLS